MKRLILLKGKARIVFAAIELLSTGENGKITLGELAKRGDVNDTYNIRAN